MTVNVSLAVLDDDDIIIIEKENLNKPAAASAATARCVNHLKFQLCEICVWFVNDTVSSSLFHL